MPSEQDAREIAESETSGKTELERILLAILSEGVRKNFGYTLVKTSAILALHKYLARERKSPS